MPGNRVLYEQSMNDGHSAAWDQEWTRAIQAYARAVQEFPDDPTAIAHLGLALFEAGQYDQALKAYIKASSLAPQDPLPVEKTADVLERLGRMQDAAQRYVAAADLYMGQRDFEKAIDNWERAIRLTPGLLKIHGNLAQAYERIGEKRKAIIEYITLAFSLQRAGDKVRAIQMLERGLRLAPNDPELLNRKQAVENNVPISLLEREGGGGVADTTHDWVDFDDEEVRAAESHPNGPLGETVENALAALAEVVFSGDLSTTSSMAIQGIELHKIGEFAEAAQAYQKAEKGGMKNPPLAMCLGAVLVATGAWQDAINSLSRLTNIKEYAAGALHGIATAYLGLQDQHKAAENFINLLRMIDTGLIRSTDEIEQINQVYGAMLRNLPQQQAEDMGSVNDQYTKWLQGKQWKVRIPETRRSLGDRLTAEGENGIFDFVRDWEVIDTVRDIDTYIRQGLLALALDQCYYVIESKPTFLPAHQRVAQIMMKQGHVQEAIVKYNIIASSFLVREDTSRAAEILNEAITVAPMDIDLRMNLINLLEKEQKWDRLTDEYASLANAYYQLADFEQSRQTYLEAMKLAQRYNAPGEKRIEILRRLAEIDVNRLDFRSAMRSYEQIRTTDPNDENARRAIVDMNYRMGNSVEAVRELDALLKVFAQQRRGDAILSTLETLVANTPNDMALRQRMAAVYRQMNRKQDAIAQLDALGELQLEAGMYQEACATIKSIITLGPGDVTQYKQLLSQLGCG